MSRPIDVHEDESYNTFMIEAYGKPTSENGIIPGLGFGNTAEMQKKSYVGIQQKPTTDYARSTSGGRKSGTGISQGKRKALARTAQRDVVARYQDAQYNNNYVYNYYTYACNTIPQFNMGANQATDLLDDPHVDNFLCTDVWSEILSFVSPMDVRNFLVARWDKRGLILLLDSSLLSVAVPSSAVPWIGMWEQLDKKMKLTITTSIIKQLA